MNLSGPFIKRPVMTSLVMIALIFFGVYAYRLLPVSDLPNVDFPTLTVTASQPGGSPDYMANLVTTPIERNLATVSGLNTLTSLSKLGRSSIVLNFDLDENLDEKEVEVQAAISKSLPDLPPMPYNPTYARNNPALAPILFLLLSSNTATIAELHEYAYNVLSQPISMINGVSEVVLYANEYAVRVQADPLKMMAHHLDFNDLSHSLVMSNPNLPAGKIRGRFDNYVIESYGQLSSAEQYNNVIIKEQDKTPLFVGDVATAIDAVNERDPFFRYYSQDNIQNMVVLGVTRLPGSNTLEVIRNIEDELPTLRKGIPASIEFQSFFNKGESIVESVHEVQLTLLIALILVVAVIFLYLGKFYETIIPSLVLPMTLVATFIVMYLLGFNLDNLSLLALTLSIGFVIDDAIVVLENIVRHGELGKSPYAAAMHGSKQIGITVITMTIALSAVFIPFIWMPGILGRLFREFSVTLVAAIFCSGIISLTLNPMLCSRFLRVASIKKQNLSQRFNQKLVNSYMTLLEHSLNWKKITATAGLSCFVFSILMLKFLPIDFLPPANLNILQGLSLMQQGSSKFNTNEHTTIVADRLQAFDYHNGFLASGGFPSDDQSRFFIRLKDASERPLAVNLARQLMAELAVVPGINTYVRPYPLLNLQTGNTTSFGDYQYTLYSLDRDNLYSSTQLMEQQMHQMPELVGVNSDLRMQSPQLNVHIDRERAGLYNIDARAIEATLQHAYSGGRISTFNKNGDLHDLILEADPRYNLLSDDLDLLYIKGEHEQMVPLSSVASWEQTVGPASINHFNTFPSATISFSLNKGAAIGPVIKQLDHLATTTLPENVIGSIQGQGKVFVETFKAMAWLTLLALFVIYILLGILYESFVHPLTILSGMPIAALGGLITLWLFNEPLSLYSAIGMIVLIGLVQKNGIMLVDFALEELEDPNKTPLQAVKEACRSRFRPIVMTTLAAMMGALPVAIGFGGQESTRSMGLVIFGGLFFSQLITLFVTPVIFLYLHKVHERLLRKKPA